MRIRTTIQSCALWGLLTCAPALHAITIANTSYNPDVSYGEIVDGINLSGVAEIYATIGGTTYGCTGSLLTNGVSILTAGHCVLTSGGLATASNVTVYFEGPNGMVSASVSNVAVDPSYSVGNSQNGSDLAVLTLSQMAPSFAVEYSLYTGVPVVNTPLVLAGYGLSGNGLAGANGSFGTLEAGENEYMGDGYDFFSYSSKLLVGEFYEAGNASTNVLGCNPRYFFACSNATPYSGFDEVDMSSGDSGGPSFYGGEIIGVHDLLICAGDANGNCIEPPSVGSTNNSYFGEMFADVSVADNLTFIEAAEGVPEPGTVVLFFGAIMWLWSHAKRRRA